MGSSHPREIMVYYIVHLMQTGGNFGGMVCKTA